MEEIQELHNLSLEWGCITNLLDRISLIEEKIEGGWPELIDMVSDAITEEGGNKEPDKVFFYLYGYLFHLLYRLKRNPEKCPFNQYSDHGDEFWITNYNYAIFKWAVAKGFTDEIDNLVIKIKKSNLTSSELKTLEKRCK